MFQQLKKNLLKHKKFRNLYQVPSIILAGFFIAGSVKFQEAISIFCRSNEVFASLKIRSRCHYSLFTRGGEAAARKKFRQAVLSGLKQKTLPFFSIN